MKKLTIYKSKESLKENNKIKKLKKEIVKEGLASHSESINQLSQQIKRFILKHRTNPNAAINSLSIGFFIGFSEAFADMKNETTGLVMLGKVMEKIKTLAKEYDGLIPEEDNDFEFAGENEPELVVDDGEDNYINEDDLTLEDYVDGEESEINEISGNLSQDDIEQAEDELEMDLDNDEGLDEIHPW